MSEVEAIGLRKGGVEFATSESLKISVLDFNDALDKSFPFAYHVKRAEFDKVLFDNSVKKGCVSHQGITVNKVSFTDDDMPVVEGIDENNQTQTWQGKFLIDATGRDVLMAKHNKTLEKNKKHVSAAIFAHLKGVEPLPDERAGHIGIYWFDQGWFWVIPFKDGTASVGAVCFPEYIRQKQDNLEQFFMEALKKNPYMYNRMKEAELVTPVTATGNYSYLNQQIYGKRWLTVGDACGFIDPVFSTGVHIALHSGEKAAQAIANSLNKPKTTDRNLKKYEQKIDYVLRQFSWYIYRTTRPAMRQLFMEPRNIFRVKEALLSLLAGDVFAKTGVTKRLWLFKMIYSIFVLFDWRANAADRKRRKKGLMGDY